MIAGAALASLFWVALYGALVDGHNWAQSILLGFAAMIGGLLILFVQEERKERRHGKG